MTMAAQIVAFALALAVEAQQGTTFVCGGFTVVAPAESVLDAHRGDARRLYRVSGEGAPQELEQVADFRPDALVISWRREHNSPVQLDIGEIDLAAGTAAYTIHAERDPSSALFMPTQTSGTCAVRSGDGT
jgi:hypothetical protein